ncbi:MAG: lysozyme [Bacteroides sp.]|nr:lysozyme [Bacteroides sp.]MCM1391047.1 lysozyme [Bacteroides sp.]
MKTSELAKAKIKEMEGLRLEAYRCPSGVLTIGYGHTGADVAKGMKITQARADALFDGDIARTEREVDMALEMANVNQCQYDALVSFTYNLGAGNLRKSTLLKKVKSYPGNPSISDEFRRWVYSKGKRLPGLVKRREWEASRYFGEL